MSGSGLRFLPAFSIICSSISVILGCLGTFSKQWWIHPQDGGKQYGLINDIICENDLCAFTPSKERDAWITFVYVAGIMSWAMILLSLVTLAIGYASKNQRIIYAAITILGIAALVSFIHTFFLIVKYIRLSLAYEVAVQSDRGLVFDLLPLAKHAIAASFTVTAVVFLATSEKHQVSKATEPQVDKKNRVV